MEPVIGGRFESIRSLEEILILSAPAIQSVTPPLLPDTGHVPSSGISSSSTEEPVVVARIACPSQHDFDLADRGPPASDWTSFDAERPTKQRNHCKPREKGRLQASLQACLSGCGGAWQAIFWVIKNIEKTGVCVIVGLLAEPENQHSDRPSQHSSVVRINEDVTCQNNTRLSLLTG